MITNQDLAVLPTAAARAATEPDPALTEAWDRFAARLADRSLDRVQRVILRLLSTASIADPEIRRALLRDADDLDAALHAAREGIFPPTGPQAHAPPAATNAGVAVIYDLAGVRRARASAQRARATARHERARNLELRRQRRESRRVSPDDSPVPEGFAR